MHVIRIADPADARLADYRDLTDVALRRALEPAGGLYMAESAKVIARALRVGHTPRSLLTQEKWMPDATRLLADHPDTPVYVVSAELARTITGYAVHRGILAAMHRPVLPSVADVLAGGRRAAGEGPAVARTAAAVAGGPPGPAPQTRSRIAVLEGLVDHANVGAAFRSAAALGIDAVLVTPRCADPLYRRSIKVSMGTVFQVPWTRLDPWPGGVRLLHEAGYVVAGMTLGAGATTLDDLVAENHERLALVVGTEGHGLRAVTERMLDRRVTIPMMHGVDSLNVAAASAVAFYATR